MDAAEEELPEYKILANSFKDEANEWFQKGDMTKAIDLYTRAIDMDPDDAVYYSNRSAAYMKADMKSKALYDAEKCIELKPSWSKAYIRLGAAQQSLKRFDAAIDTFKKGIELDPENKTLWSSLRACQDAYEADKKKRFADAALERKQEEERERRKEEIRREKKAREAENQKMADDEATLSGFFEELSRQDDDGSKQEGSSSSTGDGIAEAKKEEVYRDPEEDDLLAGFFKDVLEPKKEEEDSQKKPKVAVAGSDGDTASAVRDETERTDKYTNQDLGSSVSQYNRLMAKNYEWRNLNPYLVLQLDIDATEEDIKQRYRKLAARLHPDKLRGVEFPVECFEQVKIAYQKLQDPKQKEIIIKNIEKIRADTTKEHKKLLAKGMKESDLPPLEEQMEKALMKHFAEVEMLRRRSEHNLRAYNAREKMQEADEKEKMQADMENEKVWVEGDRREKRVGNWRNFQENPEAKKPKVSSMFKEETRADTKHGAVKLEEWKKKWK